MWRILLGLILVWGLAAHAVETPKPAASPAPKPKPVEDPTPGLNCPGCGTRVRLEQDRPPPWCPRCGLDLKHLAAGVRPNPG